MSLRFYFTSNKMTKNNKSMTAYDNRDMKQREYFSIGHENAILCDEYEN